jgi:hypothetical protein
MVLENWIRLILSNSWNWHLNQTKPEYTSKYTWNTHSKRAYIILGHEKNFNKFKRTEITGNGGTYPHLRGWGRWCRVQDQSGLHRPIWTSFKKIEIICRMFSNNNDIKLEISKINITINSINTWKLKLETTEQVLVFINNILLEQRPAHSLVLSMAVFALEGQS